VKITLTRKYCEILIQNMDSIGVTEARADVVEDEGGNVVLQYAFGPGAIIPASEVEVPAPTPAPADDVSGDLDSSIELPDVDKTDPIALMGLTVPVIKAIAAKMGIGVEGLKKTEIVNAIVSKAT
jgi:hypothetical protein